MQRKTGVLIFTHGSRLKEGNEIMVKLVDQVRQQLAYDLIEPCFMELGKPPIPVAIRKLIRRGATHIFGYAFFLVPGSHLAHLQQKSFYHKLLYARTLPEHSLRV